MLVIKASHGEDDDKHEVVLVVDQEQTINTKKGQKTPKKESYEHWRCFSGAFVLRAGTSGVGIGGSRFFVEKIRPWKVKVTDLTQAAH